MSDTYSPGDRTEQATPRRIEKAREEGSIVRAHAVAGAAVMVAGAALLWLGGGKLVDLLLTALRAGLALDPESMREPERMLSVAARVIEPGALAVGPFVALLAVVAFAGDLLIGGWALSAKPVTPDLTRISPLKGFGRLFSRAST